MPVLDDWSARLCPDGVLYRPPVGVRGGGRVHERQRPLRPFVALVKEYMRVRFAGAVVEAQVGELERLTTQDGAHAAMVPVTGKSPVDGTALQLDFGFVVGDDFYDMVLFWSSDPAQNFAMRRTARDVVYQYQLGQGVKRATRFVYTPPAGYQGLARGMAADWFPPDYPRDDAVIRVCPARPTTSEVGVLEAELAKLAEEAGLQTDGDARSEPVGSEHGLHGKLSSRLVRSGARRFHRHQIVLVDARYAYALRLDVAEGNPNASRHLAAFRRVATSAEPVPSKAPQELDVFALWNS
jgi:hypothetical protein